MFGKRNPYRCKVIFSSKSEIPRSYFTFPIDILQRPIRARILHFHFLSSGPSSSFTRNLQLGSPFLHLTSQVSDISWLKGTWRAPLGPNSMQRPHILSPFIIESWNSICNVRTFSLDEFKNNYIFARIDIFFLLRMNLGKFHWTSSVGIGSGKKQAASFRAKFRRNALKIGCSNSKNEWQNQNNLHGCFRENNCNPLKIQALFIVTWQVFPY